MSKTNDKTIVAVPASDDVPALLGFVADPSTFAASEEVAATIREQVAVSTKAGNAAMWNSALFVYQTVTVDREVGEGKRFKTNEAVIRHLGHSAKSYATLLRNLGEAAMRHGVQFGTPEWGHLCSAMSQSWEESKALRETVKGAKAPFRKALTASRKAEAVRAKAPKGLKGRGPNRQGGGSGTAGKGAKAPAKKPEAMTMGDALHAVRDLEVWLHAASPTAAKKVEAAMLKAVRGNRDRREVTAKTIKGEVVA